MSFIKKASHVQTAAAIIALLLVGFSVYKLTHHHNSQTTNNHQTVTIAPSGIKYPAAWSELPTISAADQTDGVVSEAVHVTPNATIVVRAVKGTLPKDFNIHTLATDTESSLKQGLNDFIPESNSLVSIGSHQSAQVIYKNTNDGGQVNEAVSLTIPTTNKIFYINISSLATDFTKIDSDIPAIKTAVATYIDTHLN